MPKETTVTGQNSDKDFNNLNGVPQLFLLLRPHLPAMIIAAFFMGITAITTGLYAYLIGPVMNSLFNVSETVPEQAAPLTAPPYLEEMAHRLANGNPRDLGLLIIIVALIKGVAFFTQRALVVRTGQTIAEELRLALYNGIIRQNPLQGGHQESGTLVSRFTVDAHAAETAVTEGLMALVSNALQVIILATLALALSAKLGLIGLLAFGPIGFAISRIARVLRQRQHKLYDAYSRMSGIISETCDAMFVIHGFNIADIARKRFRSENHAIRSGAIRAYLTSIISSPINELLGAGALGATLWYAQMEINADRLTPAAFISFFAALFLLYRPVKSFGRAVNAVTTGLSAMDRLNPILATDATATLEESEGTALRMTEVCAGYQPEDDILENINLKVQPGRRIALVGESGSGKTTLLQVLSGNLPISRGQLDSPWPAAAAWQHDFLFDDTIEMNIRCGNPDASVRELESAMHDAGVGLFLDSLEGGTQFKVGPNGNHLSAGQKQRVCLARALVARRPLLLLDEITAGLDGATERHVLTNLSPPPNTIVVLCTHREAAAQWADEILLMQNGRIAHHGTFDRIIEVVDDARRLFGKSSPKE